MTIRVPLPDDSTIASFYRKFYGGEPRTTTLPVDIGIEANGLGEEIDSNGNRRTGYVVDATVGVYRSDVVICVGRTLFQRCDARYIFNDFSEPGNWYHVHTRLVNTDILTNKGKVFLQHGPIIKRLKAWMSPFIEQSATKSFLYESEIERLALLSRRMEGDLEFAIAKLQKESNGFGKAEADAYRELARFK